MAMVLLENKARGYASIRKCITDTRCVVINQWDRIEKQATNLQQIPNCNERHNGLSINVLLLKMSHDPIPHHTQTK